MDELLQRLRKVLEHERRTGYGDRAVTRGLDAFLKNWTAEAASAAAGTPWAARIRALTANLPTYRALSQRDRAEWIDATLNWLGRPLAAGHSLAPPVPRPVRSPAPLPQQPPAEHGRDRRGAPITAGRSREQPIRRAAGSATPAEPTASRRTHAQPSSRKAVRSITLDAPVTALPRIDRGMAAYLTKLGIRTVEDLLLAFPYRHDDYSRLKPIADLEVGEDETVVALIWDVSVRRGVRGTDIVEAVVGDATGNMRVVWFNQPYLAKQLAPNQHIVLSGRVKVFQGRKTIEVREWEVLESDDLTHTGRLVPVYHTTQGLSRRRLRGIVKAVVDDYAGLLDEVDPIPPAIRARRGFLPRSVAVQQMHFPDSEAMLARARERLAFEELLAIALGGLIAKRAWQDEHVGNPLAVDPRLLEAFTQSLPFSLTAAQRRVLDEILTDLQSSRPMARLLQGEVGSGKTVVAAAALLVAVANGFQGAMMAPTEILAEQHYRTLADVFGRLAVPAELVPRTGESPDGSRAADTPPDLFALADLSVESIGRPAPRWPRIALLTGSLSRSQKEDLTEQIARGEVDIVVGTHALIQEDVEFARLGLVVIDEQHRFGVEQRAALKQRGVNPHLLVMSATPIPRTLALTLYGDLDLSTIDELPPGRRPVRTKLLRPDQRDRAYEFIRQQVAAGRQAFIIYPLVEDSDRLDARSAVAEYERLQRDVFPDLRLGLLHGRLRAGEKDEILRRFRDRDLEILVCTSVVEVGIDIPNASVMLIDGADRFGLAQLHQFRGRVGRGEHESYCLLLADSPSDEARRRLGLLETTTDGLKLAELDLQLRGPGEFFGTRQSGLPDLRVASLSDLPLIEAARQEAQQLLAADPTLSNPEHRLIVEQATRLWSRGGDVS